MDNLLHGALLNELLRDQSHNFNNLVHDLRIALNRHLRLAIWTQPPKIAVLASISQFLFQTCRHRVCRRRSVLGLLTRIPECGILVTMPNVDQICSIFPALSAQQKQDHSFATHTKQRTLVKLSGLHASCILASKSDRSYTTSFTGFASVAPVRMDRTETSLLKFLNTLSNSLQSNLSSIVAVHRSRSDRTPQRSHLVWDSNVPHKETQALVLHCLVLDVDDQLDCRILSATFLTASSFAFLASLSGFVLGVQILGALRALPSISVFLCASLGPRCSLLLLATSHPSQSHVWGSSFGHMV